MREVQCCHCTATIPIIKSSTEPAPRALFHILFSFSKVRHGSSTSFTRLDPQNLSLLFHVLFNQSSRPVCLFSDLIRFVFVCSDPARDEFQTEILTYLRNFSLFPLSISQHPKEVFLLQSNAFYSDEISSPPCVPTALHHLEHQQAAPLMFLLLSIFFSILSTCISLSTSC